MKKSLKGRSYPREKAKKVLRMMKISVVLMLFCLQIQANVYSQHTRLSLKLENASIKQLFTEIEKKSDVAFVYNAGDVDHLGTVNVNFTNEEIGKILDFCLKGKGVEYSFVDNHIVIHKKTVQLPQQTVRVVSGKILDKNTGEPLPGATVKIKGTIVGTAADIDGKFKLSVTDGTSLLEVSFIGYKNVEIDVSKRTEMVVMLEPLIAEMSEVIVTGFQRREKAVMVGSVSTATARDLLLQSVLYFLPSTFPLILRPRSPVHSVFLPASKLKRLSQDKRVQRSLLKSFSKLPRLHLLLK